MLVFKHNSSMRATYDKDNATQISSNLEVALGHFLAERNDHGATLTSFEIVSLVLIPNLISIEGFVPRRLTI